MEKRYKVTKGEHAGKIGVLSPFRGTAYGGSYGFPLSIDDRLYTLGADEVEPHDETLEMVRECVRNILEARIRETDITDGTRVPFGSEEHVGDLEARISDLERWRDRQRRGSEARANYARLISALKRELRAAHRVNEPKPALIDPTLEPELYETDKPKVVHWEHTRGTGPACGKSGSSAAIRDKVTCSKCKKMIAKERSEEQ